MCAICSCSGRPPASGQSQQRDIAMLGGSSGRVPLTTPGTAPQTLHPPYRPRAVTSNLPLANQGGLPYFGPHGDDLALAGFLGAMMTLRANMLKTCLDGLP
jgi:hypothetical protein